MKLNKFSYCIMMGVFVTTLTGCSYLSTDNVDLNDVSRKIAELKC